MFGDRNFETKTVAKAAELLAQQTWQEVMEVSVENRCERATENRGSQSDRLGEMLTLTERLDSMSERTIEMIY